MSAPVGTREAVKGKSARERGGAAARPTGGERLRCVTGAANEKVEVNEPNTITSLEVFVTTNTKAPSLVFSYSPALSLLTLIFLLL